MTKYLIIGGGIAGTTAAERIRKLDPTGAITIIDLEQHRLYSRVLLAKYVEGQIEREKIFLKREQWYSEQNIELMSGVEVVSIDAKNQFVLTSEGRELPYEKLLITTGGEVKLLPEDLRGVSYLRTLDDADHLIKLIAELRTLPSDQQAAAIFGGGFISLEYINIFAHYNINTTILMRSLGFWSRVMSKSTQDILLSHAVARGMAVKFEERDLSLIGKNEIEGLELKDGSILPTRLLGVGIGLEMKTKIFLDAGLEVQNGLLVNSYLETNLPNIYAAGDIVEFHDVIAGRRLRAGNWMSAIMQARAVASTMTGKRTEFRLVSSYSASLLGMQIVFVGDTSREHADEVIQHIEGDDHATELFVRGGKLVGGIMVGDTRERQEITKAIQEGGML
ncbi:MAG: FAD-dependent oxidoreductase [Candidatus Uhrbacteria bacterium]|nr:FAD-dependent oxidoreductase [Candidatus Uhrbacteria bacterium]